MARDLIQLCYRWLHEVTAGHWRQRLPPPELFGPAPAKIAYRRLQRVVLTEDVRRTFFVEYASHRAGSRGDEEIGWVLLGLRLEDEIHVLATLPAGTARSASSVHVRFDSEAQAFASRVVRQRDKRLAIVGVVHTHPGSLRHPSGGDYQGDSLWVRHLRGGEGVFGIGTADGPASTSPHMQIEGNLCFSWYALSTNDRQYRRLPVATIAGPDLALPLHGAWPILEKESGRLDRLFRQLSGVTLETVEGGSGPLLALNVKLAEPGNSLRILLDGRQVQYYLNRQGDLCGVDPSERNLERAVYLILAELADAGPAQPKELVHGLQATQ